MGRTDSPICLAGRRVLWAGVGMFTGLKVPDLSRKAWAWTGHPSVCLALSASLQSICPNAIPGLNNKQEPRKGPQAGIWGVQAKGSVGLPDVGLSDGSLGLG